MALLLEILCDAECAKVDDIKESYCHIDFCEKLFFLSQDNADVSALV